MPVASRLQVDEYEDPDADIDPELSGWRTFRSIAQRDSCASSA